MTFLSPWAFGFLGVVPVIVLLYLLKIKRRSAVVSTLMFWQRVLVENRRRALFQRLRQLLSLLFHLLIFLLILLALSKPEWSRFAGTGTSTVLIVDTRARMQAIEPDGESRFAKARRALAGYVRRAGAQNMVALLACGADAQVIVPFSDDEKLLQQGVGRLAVTDASGDLEAAIAFAKELLASRPGHTRIVVFTDRPVDGVECVAVGTPLENVAITQFAARRLFNSPQTSQVLLRTRNFGAKPARGSVELFYDDALVDVKPFDLAPGAEQTDVLPILPQVQGPGRLRARLDAKDALAVDNEAFAVLPSAPPRRVLLVTRGNWFIEKMLEADEGTKWELLAPESFSLELAKNFDAVILDDALPPGFDLESAAGNFLFLKQTPFSADARIDQPLVSESDARSPLLRLVAFQNVTFLRASRMTPRESLTWKWETPLRAFDEPLIIAGVRGEQRLAAFAFDIAETDLPLRVAFPLLMSNTLEWLAGAQPDRVTSLRAGETLPLAAGERVSSAPSKANLPADSTITDEFRPSSDGWYSIQNGNSSTSIAVNTFSESESDLRFASAASRAPLRNFAEATLFAWPLWTWFALAGFLLFALEWWLFHRRRTE